MKRNILFTVLIVLAVLCSNVAVQAKPDTAGPDTGRTVVISEEDRKAIIAEASAAIEARWRKLYQEKAAFRKAGQTVPTRVNRELEKAKAHYDCIRSGHFTSKDWNSVLYVVTKSGVLTEGGTAKAILTDGSQINVALDKYFEMQMVRYGLEKSDTSAGRKGGKGINMVQQLIPHWFIVLITIVSILGGVGLLALGVCAIVRCTQSGKSGNGNGIASLCGAGAGELRAGRDAQGLKNPKKTKQSGSGFTVQYDHCGRVTQSHNYDYTEV